MPETAPGGSLVDRHVGFVHALRAAGLPVSVAEGLDAANALRVIELADRESLRAAYAATLVKKPAYRPGFDVLFDLWFPAAMSGIRPASPRTDLATAEVKELREHLAGLLIGSTDQELREFVQAMVARFGRQEAGPGRQNWFSYSVLRALSPETLMAGILREVLGAVSAAGWRSRTYAAASTPTCGASRTPWPPTYAAASPRTPGSNASPARPSAPARPGRLPARHQGRPGQAAQEVHPLARRLAARLTIRHRKGRRGRLDFRRTMRASLQSGGVPLDTHFRPPRPHRPELVVLCDTSDSVSSFAHFTLLLTYALREQFTKVRAFGFVDTVDEITRFFLPGSDVVEAMTRLANEADLVRFGRTNYGHSLERFAERYGDAIGQKTSLLILGDARSNYQPPALDVLASLASRARHAYWLNPEPKPQWDTGDSVAGDYGAVVPMYECRNVAQLTAFIETLA
ncbi:VWA domain-containing protein [Nonomuraea antimicrobica]